MVASSTVTKDPVSRKARKLLGPEGKFSNQNLLNRSTVKKFQYLAYRILKFDSCLLNQHRVIRKKNFFGRLSAYVILLKLKRKLATLKGKKKRVCTIKGVNL